MKKGIKQVEELANALIKLLDRETVDKFIEDEHGNLKMIKTYSLYEIAKELYNEGFRKCETMHCKKLINDFIAEIRKQTAKEILNSIIADDFYTGGSYELTFKDLRELAEKYGVEVEQ